MSPNGADVVVLTLTLTSESRAFAECKTSSQLWRPGRCWSQHAIVKPAIVARTLREKGMRAGRHCDRPP
jgi:hypothetical protein